MNTQYTRYMAQRHMQINKNRNPMCVIRAMTGTSLNRMGHPSGVDEWQLWWRMADGGCKLQAITVRLNGKRKPEGGVLAKRFQLDDRGWSYQKPRELT
jgi:hypothetical protein